MNITANTKIQEQFNALDRAERKKILLEAQRRRKDWLQRNESRSRKADDEVLRTKRVPSLEQFALQILSEERDEAIASISGGEEVGTAEVIWTGLGRCHVWINDTVQVCAVPPHFAEANDALPAVGDVARLRRRGDGLTVAGLVDRKTVLSRPDPVNPHRHLVVAANMDVVVIVVSVVAPPLHPRIIDRYLIAIQRGGARPMIYVNKSDLLASESDRIETLRELQPYARIGIPILLASAIEPEGAVQQLRELLRGKTCVFVGHSGVGKSSTINALAPHLSLDTGDVWAGYGRGTHTTTASSLHDLGDGTRLIDTPGIRSFGIADVPLEELAWYFPEFEAYASRCKYRDCSHTHEPKCGVRDAANRGDISGERFETYLRLMNGLAD